MIYHHEDIIGYGCELYTYPTLEDHVPIINRRNTQRLRYDITTSLIYYFDCCQLSL